MWSIDLTRRRWSRLNAKQDRSSKSSPLLVLLSTAHAGHDLVVQRCERSAAIGVQPGMTLAHARALLDDVPVHLEPDDPSRSMQALRALALWAARFSPVVAIDPPDGLLIDIGGCQHLFGGEKPMLRRLLKELHRMGFDARAASAPTFACAWAMARFARPALSTVAAGGVIEALSPLPIPALRIDDKSVSALAELGVQQIGQLLKLPRRALPSRFGNQLLLRLDQALGAAMEMIEPVRAEPPAAAERDFDGPTRNPQAIALTVRKLLGKLCNRLHCRESGTRQITIELVRVDAAPIAIAIRLSYASRQTEHLWHLVRPRLEKVNLGFGVERITATASHCRKLPHRQNSCWQDHSRSAGKINEMIDAMVNRLGARLVTRMTPIESHIPERAAHHHTAMSTPDSPDRTPKAAIIDTDRPTLLLVRPRPIRVMAAGSQDRNALRFGDPVVPEGPPIWFHMDGQDHHVAASAGPERIEPEWWNHRCPTMVSTRDYFKIQDDQGRWLWIYRELKTGWWFVHGQWA